MSTNRNDLKEPQTLGELVEAVEKNMHYYHEFRNELAAIIKDRDDYKRAYESALVFYERLLTADNKLANCPSCGSKLNWCTECEKYVNEA